MGLSSGLEDMAEDTALSELLTQLDAIANAPLTGSQREARARPLLESAGVTVADVGRAVGRAELGWNQAKAKEYGVSPQTWLHAVRAVNLSASRTVNDLLYGIHQAEAAVRMLGAGYAPAEDESGQLPWSRDEPDSAADTR
jgi:hypothetical protein